MFGIFAPYMNILIKNYSERRQFYFSLCILTVFICIFAMLLSGGALPFAVLAVMGAFYSWLWCGLLTEYEHMYQFILMICEYMIHGIIFAAVIFLIIAVTIVSSAYFFAAAIAIIAFMIAIGILVI